MDERIKKEFIETFGILQHAIHSNGIDKGFWPEFVGIDREDEHEMVDARARINVGHHIALTHSELSEALEAARKAIPEQDKNCPQFSNFTVELADTVIRVMDLAAARGLPLAEAIITKLEFNKGRPFKHGKRF